MALEGFEIPVTKMSNKVLFENLIVTQIVEKVSTLYETPRV